MPGLLPNVDPDGLLEFSVVYTDRSLNHMSKQFQQIVKDISAVLKETYNARSAVIVPGSGTFGMESVARQFAQNQKCLIVRNGWFSYRWTQILEMANLTQDVHVLKAKQIDNTTTGAFAPPPIGEVVAFIKKEKRLLYLFPMLKHPPESSCRTTMCRPSVQRLNRSTEYLSWTASLPAQCGST